MISTFWIVVHDTCTDLPLIAFPIFPLPAGMVLMPLLPLDEPSTSPDSPSRREQRSRAVSREGPFVGGGGGSVVSDTAHDLIYDNKTVCLGWC